MSWRADAACLGMPELFFAEAVGQGYGRGRRVCAGCRVLVECRGYALRVLPEYGLWGGLSPDERRQAVAAPADGV